MLAFPVHAIFIGANLGLATVAFFQKIFEYFAKWAVVLNIIALLSSAILCILASEHFFVSKNLAMCALWILLGSYGFLIILAFWLPSRMNMAAESKAYTAAATRES